MKAKPKAKAMPTTKELIERQQRWACLQMAAQMVDGKKGERDIILLAAQLSEWVLDGKVPPAGLRMVEKSQSPYPQLPTVSLPQ